MERRLVVVDDNKAILAAVQAVMRGKGITIQTTTRPEELPSLLRSSNPQVVLLDMNFRSKVNNGNEGLFWLREIKRLSPQTAVVLFTAYADVALAVEGMKLGAVDFIVKPFDNDVLADTLIKAFGSASKEKRKPTQMLWGTSPRMVELKRVVERVAPTDANVLITGENGTGKDLLARELHGLSARSAGPIEIVDMGAVIETLFESELYGHAKGAFTDAHSDREGKFEKAHGGTLFLDEIGNLPLHLQSKLLTAIQQRTIVRVGSNTPRPIDIRLICATNRDIPAMVAAGEFRQDLFYRINTVTLALPPLRERPEDIPAFVDLFLTKYAKAYGRDVPSVSDEALRRLASQRWPGNLRQLEHTIEKALILSDSSVLTVADFDFHDNATHNTSVDTSLESVERTAIAKSIKQNAGNLAAVARELGITRQTLYNKVKKYGL